MVTRRDIFQAIADPTRRAILSLLTAGWISPSAIASQFDSSRQTIAKHLQILNECDLLISDHDNGERKYRLNLDKINEIDTWLEQFKEIHESRLDNVEVYLEKLMKQRAETGGFMKTRDEAISTDTFVIEHTFIGNANEVFKMWTDPKMFSDWLGPEGSKMLFLSSCVQEGATSQWAMTTNDGLTKYGQISFKVINPNTHLVYTQNFCDKEGHFIKAPFSDTYPDYLLTTVQFSEIENQKTRVTVKWDIYGPANQTERETFLGMKDIMRTGWSASFLKLESLLK